MAYVIGIGNRLMMDDGVAVAVLESIKNNLEAMRIEVLIGETDFQFCFYQLKENEFVFLLDATYSEVAAGSIHLYRLEEAIAAYGETSFQHLKTAYISLIHRRTSHFYLVFRLFCKV